MGDGKSSAMKGILILIAGGVLLTVCRQYFPQATTFVLTMIGLVLLLMTVFMIFILVLALRRPNENKQGTEGADAAIREGRKHLMEIQRVSMRIQNRRIQSLGEEICQQAERVLTTLKDQPDDISGARQFFSYYLPTIKTILSRYRQMEEGNAANQEETEHVTECLNMVKNALIKQEKNLFENDKPDLSVEMEALRIACQRDGLPESDDFTKEI